MEAICDPMVKRSNLLFCLLVHVFLFSRAFASAADSEMIQRLDGRVISADESKRVLAVQFDHPVSGEQIQKEFLISNDTRFRHVKTFNRIKAGDLVTVDYREQNEKATAIYVDVVPIERQLVSPAELAGSLVKIKTAQRNMKV